MSNLPYAEDINYWMTSKTSADNWMESTKKLIINFGGQIIGEAFGSEPKTGRAAYMITFSLQNAQYKIVWPVLQTRGKNERAARIQAATMLFHDVKAKLISADVLGVKTAFFSYLLLPDGRTASQASYPELNRGIPALFGVDKVMIGPGDDVVDGEVRINRE